ncbi:MAG TPA: hypothetical protein VIG69_01955 [Candidatus Methylomirabilis sp.]|jgi:hypothetical protein
MGRLTGLTAGVLAWLGALVSPAPTLDTPNERVTLAGLTGVHVVVEEVLPEAERDGLTRAALQTEVEQRVRRAGLRVLTATDAMASVGRPTVTVRVTLLRPRETPQLYVFGVDLTLRQQIRLVRDRGIESFAITWSETRDVGAVPAARLAAVRDAVRAKVDRFLNAWQTVNQDR